MNGHLMGKFFPDCTVSLSCILRMEAKHSSQIAVNFNWATWHHISEDSIQCNLYF